MPCLYNSSTNGMFGFKKFKFQNNCFEFLFTILWHIPFFVLNAFWWPPGIEKIQNKTVKFAWFCFCLSCLDVYDHSSIIKMSIKVVKSVSVHLYLAVAPEPVSVMLLFLYTVLSLYHLNTKAENTLCQMMGNPKYPLLSKEGDITIGALFVIHSEVSLPSFEFTQKPNLLSCSRYVIVFFFYY